MVGYQVQLEEVHRKSFETVCGIIDADIIQKNAVMRLTYLKDIYVEGLRDTKFSNPGYRKEKLKSTLIKQYEDIIV